MKRGTTHLAREEWPTTLWTYPQSQTSGGAAITVTYMGPGVAKELRAICGSRKKLDGAKAGQKVTCGNCKRTRLYAEWKKRKRGRA